MYPKLDNDLLEDGDERRFDFSEMSIRAAFIRKVFSIVIIMLVIVTSMTVFPYLHGGTQQFILQNRNNIILASLVIYICLAILLICCTGIRRRYPINLFLTLLLAIAFGFVVMCVAQTVRTESVIMALAMTIFSCVAICLYVTQTKRDLTRWYDIMCILGLMFCIFGAVGALATIWWQTRWISVVYSLFGALLGMGYLAIDVQLIMGGRSLEISPEDYIFASLQIFLDIVQIFLCLIRIFDDA